MPGRRVARSQDGVVDRVRYRIRVSSHLLGVPVLLLRASVTLSGVTWYSVVKERSWISNHRVLLGRRSGHTDNLDPRPWA